MSKKKEIKKIFENMELESSDAHADLTGAGKEETGQDVSTPNVEQAGDEETSLRAEMPAAEQEEHPEPEPEQESAASGMEKVGDEEISLRAEMLAAEQESKEEAPAPVVEAAQEEAANPAAETSPAGPEQPAGQGEAEDSPDDILEDVRKSLLEEEEHEHEKQPKWWRRIGRSSRKKNVEEDMPKPAEEINMPALAAMQAVGEEAEPSQEKDEYQEQIDELIDLLDTEEETVEAPSAPLPVDVPVEPEKPVDIEELKKQAFQPRPEEEGKENVTEVRSIALEGDEEVFVEVEAKPQDPLEERISAVENALKPYQKTINFGLAFLGFVMAVTAAFLIYNAYRSSTVQSTPTEVVSNLPYPISVGLPGGWQFSLGQGSLTPEGSWNPAGAEWLRGTEVCRWVALPWSRQLEAVIRTLNPDDPIELGMSNNDKLVYNVYSIQQMSPQEMRELDSNQPCLLIVLAEPEEEKRWVLTALP